jgi:hypothetical protein
VPGGGSTPAADVPEPDDPVIPAQRPARAKANEATKHNSGKPPVRGYGDLPGHLATRARPTISFNGQRIGKLTIPTSVQRRTRAGAEAFLPLPEAGAADDVICF